MGANAKKYNNPYRPGAGHMPPYLAGRDDEKSEFARFLDQDVILSNVVLTGLRGMGKTVLLDTFKPMALERGWKWVGTDMSEAATLTEENIALRLLTDLSVVTSSVVITRQTKQVLGFGAGTREEKRTLTFGVLRALYDQTPGLVADKLKQTLLWVWDALRTNGSRGVIFAYDEAQNLADHAEKTQYPMSLLLDVFQSIQKQAVPFMLVLTGLPTLFPKLVEARTFAERMFHMVVLDKLEPSDRKDAILKPLKPDDPRFSPDSVERIADMSDGYPYFIQFICREVFDLFNTLVDSGQKPVVPVEAILAKLDSDFFAGRWARATDRQRELLIVIASLESCESEFTVQEVVEASKKAPSKSFSGSHANQMLASLTESGLVYKNRHGKYSFAVPLLGQFIRRQSQRS